ncbi:MAG TPA: hypothetical protein VNC79_00205 [Mycobacteriales bacterium]|jgi:hypothetical protein|nr:hypothetical protein [Mycobacteriales bacterium]
MTQRDDLPDASEVTLPQGGEGGVDRPSPPGYHDPAERGSDAAPEPPPEADAERLESALRDGAGFLRIADPDGPRRRAEETEEGPGTSLP